jgi:hypothetical protein
VYNEELHNLYASLNIIRAMKSRRIRCADHVARRGGREICTKLWSENLKGRELGRQRHIWEDNIRTDVRELGWEGVDWIHLDGNQWWDLVNTVTNFRVS